VLTIAVVNEFEQVPAAVSVRIVLVSIRRINVYFFVKQENETGRHRIIVVHHTIADVADFYGAAIKAYLGLAANYGIPPRRYEMPRAILAGSHRMARPCLSSSFRRWILVICCIPPTIWWGFRAISHLFNRGM
jgi:hypothetical protein